MQIGIDGQWNIAGLEVPGEYVDIIPPAPNLVGAPTNVVGLVGVAPWGQVGGVTMVSDTTDAAVKIGTPQIRSHDMATYIWAAQQVGGGAQYACVRVSDGTDTAATATVQTDCLTLTAYYSGSLGNSISLTLNNGTQANTFMATISFPGLAAEIFNNVPGTGNAFWVNLANAINNGNATHGPSKIVVASAGAGTATPTLATPVTLSGGTDGASGVTDATLVGVDTIPRKGMYALRSSGVAAFTLCDLSTSSLWPSMDSFALSEACLNCVSTVSGDTISNAATSRTTVGLDSSWTWIAVGDFPTFYDSQNKVSRLVSPSAYQIAIIGNQSPEQSPLNKILRGISATQKTESGQAYGDADLQVLNTSGLDLISGPPTTPGGDYYAFASGRNASSNTGANGVEYTTMTNFLARSAQSKAGGSIIGKLQSSQPGDRTRQEARDLFNGFSSELVDLNMIDSFSVVCDLSNNPPAIQARGYLFLTWQVRYLNVVRYFIVKLAAGGNVTVTVQSTPPTAAQFAAAA